MAGSYGARTGSHDAALVHAVPAFAERHEADPGSGQHDLVINGLRDILRAAAVHGRPG